MADRSLTVTEGQLLRELQRDVADLKRTRSQGGGQSTGLPFRMGDWVFEETPGGLTATNIITGGVLAGGGEPGATGPTGPTGPAGANGTNGHSVLSGTVAPTSSDGSNGDFWIDTVAHMLWGPKAAGAWPGGPVPLTYDPTYSIGFPGYTTAKIVGTWHGTFPIVPVFNNVVHSPVALALPSSGGVSFIPVYFPWQVTIDTFKYYIVGAGGAGCVIRAGVYGSSISTGLPTGAATLMGAEQTGTTGSTTKTVSAAYTFNRNTLYWFALQYNSVAGLTIRASPAITAGWPGATIDSLLPSSLGAASTVATVLTKQNSDIGGYAAGLPTNPAFISSDVRITGGSGTTPIIMVRVAS